MTVQLMVKDIIYLSVVYIIFICVYIIYCVYIIFV